MTFEVVAALIAGGFAVVLARPAMAMLPWPWWGLRFVETPRHGIKILHLTTGMGPWRKPRDVVYKEFDKPVYYEGLAPWDPQRPQVADDTRPPAVPAHGTIRRYDHCVEYYWADTGKPLGLLAIDRVVDLKERFHDQQIRRDEASVLSEVALAKLLSEGE